MMSGGLAFFAGHCPCAVSGEVWQNIRAAVAVWAVYTLAIHFTVDVMILNAEFFSALKSVYRCVIKIAIFAQNDSFPEENCRFVYFVLA